MLGPESAAGEACTDQLLYRQSCAISPLKVIKTVRYRMDQVSELLDDPELQNLKVIFLSRDPRGIVASR